MGNSRCVKKFVLMDVSVEATAVNRHRRTGTFFWVSTTLVSFPLIAIAVCPEPEIALNAYSVLKVSIRERGVCLYASRTDLVKATLV